MALSIATPLGSHHHHLPPELLHLPELKPCMHQTPTSHDFYYVTLIPFFKLHFKFWGTCEKHARLLRRYTHGSVICCLPPHHELLMSFYLFRSSLISFSKVLSSAVHKCYTSPIKYITKCFSVLILFFVFLFICFCLFVFETVLLCLPGWSAVA